MLSLEYLLTSGLNDDECALLYIDNGFVVVDNKDKVVDVDGIKHVEVRIGEDRPALIRLDSIPRFEIMDKIEFVMASMEVLSYIAE